MRKDLNRLTVIGGPIILIDAKNFTSVGLHEVKLSVPPLLRSNFLLTINQLEYLDTGPGPSILPCCGQLCFGFGCARELTLLHGIKERFSDEYERYQASHSVSSWNLKARDLPFRKNTTINTFLPIGDGPFGERVYFSTESIPVTDTLSCGKSCSKQRHVLLSYFENGGRVGNVDCFFQRNTSTLARSIAVYSCILKTIGVKQLTNCFWQYMTVDSDNELTLSNEAEGLLRKEFGSGEHVEGR